MTKQYHDRFSKAVEELPEKNAFICHTCDTKYSDKEAKSKMMSCCGRTLTELLRESVGP
ncbi:hypothetical protein DBW_1974 [Desulfuromonas sp. DDH964]|nr:hypothetical protein DBW_1974 [Desulfuromonas sp. DDH964]